MRRGEFDAGRAGGDPLGALTSTARTGADGAGLERTASREAERAVVVAPLVAEVAGALAPEDETWALVQRAQYERRDQTLSPPGPSTADSRQTVTPSLGIKMAKTVAPLTIDRSERRGKPAVGCQRQSLPSSRDWTLPLRSPACRDDASATDASSPAEDGFCAS